MKLNKLISSIFTIFVIGNSLNLQISKAKEENNVLNGLNRINTTPVDSSASKCELTKKVLKDANENSSGNNGGFGNGLGTISNSEGSGNASIGNNGITSIGGDLGSTGSNGSGNNGDSGNGLGTTSNNGVSGNDTVNNGVNGNSGDSGNTGSNGGSGSGSGSSGSNITNTTSGTKTKKKSTNKKPKINAEGLNPLALTLYYRTMLLEYDPYCIFKDNLKNLDKSKYPLSPSDVGSAVKDLLKSLSDKQLEPIKSSFDTTATEGLKKYLEFGSFKLEGNTLKFEKKPNTASTFSTPAKQRINSEKTPEMDNLMNKGTK